MSYDYTHRPARWNAGNAEGCWRARPPRTVLGPRLQRAAWTRSSTFLPETGASSKNWGWPSILSNHYTVTHVWGGERSRAFYPDRQRCSFRPSERPPPSAKSPDYPPAAQPPGQPPRAAAWGAPRPPNLRRSLRSLREACV